MNIEQHSNEDCGTVLLSSCNNIVCKMYHYTNDNHVIEGVNHMTTMEPLLTLYKPNAGHGLP